MAKPVLFLGDSRERLRGFQPVARERAGYALFLVQRGLEPPDWKAMPSIGQGVREIRVQDESGQYRVIYVASVGESVLVLHAFQKKTQKTAQSDIAIAKKRLKEWRNDRSI
jgi:phage-related protein